MRTLAGILVLSPVLTALAQSPAETKTPPPATTAAVFARPADDGARALSGRFEIELTRALIGKGLDVADFDELFPAPPTGSTAEGDALMDAGKEAFNNLDPDAALQKFTDAATFYAGHPLETTPEKMAAAFVAIGATVQLNGQPLKAQEAFRRALVLSPNVEPDEVFGPDVKKAVEQARAKLDALPKGQIQLDSQPEGARALLDGTEVGLTPVPAKDAPVGRHHVVLKRPGYLPFGAYPDVTADKPAELKPTLEPSPALAKVIASVDRLATPEGFKASSLPVEAKAVGASVKARFLVLSRVTGGADGAAKAEVQAWDLSTGNKLDGLSVDLSHDDWRSTDQLAERLRQWITRPPPPPEVATAGAPPILKKWWFWTAVGVVAAGAATTVAVSQTHGHRPDFVLGLP